MRGRVCSARCAGEDGSDALTGTGDLTERPARDPQRSATHRVRHRSARTSKGNGKNGTKGRAPANPFGSRANAPASHATAATPLFVRTLRRRTPPRPLRWPHGPDPSSGGVATECDSSGAAPECSHQQGQRQERHRRAPTSEGNGKNGTRGREPAKELAGAAPESARTIAMKRDRANGRVSRFFFYSAALASSQSASISARVMASSLRP
jgi:hypothetical protein